jgi:hypothetical protein
MNLVRCFTALFVVLPLTAGSLQAQDRGAKTFDYWSKIKGICEEEIAGISDSSPVTKQVAAMRNIARRINDLSARGVDPDAIEVAEKMVKLFKRTGSYIDDYGDADRGFKSGFRDGLNKNPTRVIDERKAIERDAADAKETASRIRKRLEAQYDRDFPTLLK